MKMHELMFRGNIWNVMVKLFRDDVDEKMYWKFSEDDIDAYYRILKTHGFVNKYKVADGVSGICRIVDGPEY